MAGSKYELTKAQEAVLKAISRLSRQRVPITGARIRKACVDPGTADCVSRPAMYKALGALRAEGLIREGEVAVPGRRSKKKTYNLDYVALGDGGLLGDIQ